MERPDATQADDEKWPTDSESSWKHQRMPPNSYPHPHPSPGSTQATASMLRKKLSSYFTVKMLKKRLPICEWLPKYRLSYLQHDVVAGITVVLTLIPQGMAYANLAGLPLQYGLYTSFMGLFTYSLFGTMRMIHIGPTSMMAILILDHVIVGGPAYAVWLSFLSGCVEILLGIFRMGTLVDFISLPVASGFSSAASVIVIVNLFKSILGLKFSSSSFLDLVYKLMLNIPKTNYWDLTLGSCCLVTLIFLKKLNEKVKTWGKGRHQLPTWQQVCSSSLWFFLTTRNALVVIAAAVIAFVLINSDQDFLTLSADIEPGLPGFSFPPLSIERDGETLGLVKIFGELGWGIALVPLVAILQHIAIAKSFAQGRSVDATQEVITLGLCNVLGSFVSAFPVTASFSRTALNVSTGIKTTLASIITGSLVLVALGVLAPTFRYIPKATLAAVIINAVFSMIEYEMIPQLWRTKRSDLAVWIITFIGCLLLEAEYGILTGIAFSLLVLLYTTFKPRLTLRHHDMAEGEIVIVEPDRALYFPSVEYTRYKVNKMTRDGTALPVIFDGAHMCGADYTTAQGFKRLSEDFKKRNRAIVYTNFTDEVLRVINSIHQPDFVHCQSEDDLKNVLANCSKMFDKTIMRNKDSMEDVQCSEDCMPQDQQKYGVSMRHINSDSSGLRLLPSSNNLELGPDSPTELTTGPIRFDV